MDYGLCIGASVRSGAPICPGPTQRGASFQLAGLCIGYGLFNLSEYRFLELFLSLLGISKMKLTSVQFL